MAEAARLRVVFLDHTAAPSGAELALLATVAHLDVERHVLLGADGPLAVRFGQVADVEVLPMPQALARLTRGGVPVGLVPGLVGYVWRLSRRLRALRPDVVYVNSLRSGLYGAPAARLARVPVVWHVRDRLSADYLGPRTAAVMRLLVCRLSTTVIANSHATAATVPAGVPVTVVPSPLSGPARERGTRTGPLLYVAASRLSPWKGQDVFLRAFAHAFPDGEQRAVVLGAAQFGERAYGAGLVRLVAELGLRDRVSFLGHRDDVMAELSRCDVLVHSPTLPEPFGRVVVEGLAAGLVVVARGDGGPAETLTDGVDGLLYAPDRPDDLVGLLRRVDGDEGLRRRLVEAGQVRARDFAPELVAARVLAVCQQVGRTGASPRRFNVAR